MKFSLKKQPSKQKVTKPKPAGYASNIKNRVDGVEKEDKPISTQRTGDLIIKDIDEISQQKKELVIKPASIDRAQTKKFIAQVIVPVETSLGNGLNKETTEDEKSPATNELVVTDTKEKNSSTVAIAIGQNPNADSYDKVPVAEFGMAMLRGMKLNNKK